MKTVQNNVVAAKGFRCGTASCGLKRAPGALDVGLIVSDLPAVAAAAFTTNRVKAAPVVLSQARLRGTRFCGVVVNAGNANACTGEQGWRDAVRMTELAAQTTGATPEQFLVASTGVIGRQMPMTKVESGIVAAAAALGRTIGHAKDIAKAIMTTDLVPKAIAVETVIGGKPVRVGGIAKGSGMIAPNMATMLAFITTDCDISSPLLRRALRDTVKSTFNCITVDGDCSTNDSAFVFANGAAGNKPIQRTGKDYAAVAKALYVVAEHLAKAIARDGEGATRFVEVNVDNGRTLREATTVARSIANSPLVKTAVHGGDPNWGRIICAAGYSGAHVDPGKMRLRVNAVELFRNGTPCKVAARRLEESMKPKDIIIHLDLGRGKHSATVWTCDFSRDYIRINADYHT